ncbi:ABC transporter permease [candidate division KSB1 bacterium]
MKKNNKNNPPVLAGRLVKLFSQYDEEFDLQKTLHELYFYKYKTDGKMRASLWYWRQILYSLPKYYYSKFFWSFIMFKNYLKITLRNIIKHKGYSFINISGLAVGLACCILMLLWIHNELSFDRFHKNTDELYRVISKVQTSNEVTHTVRSANASGPALVSQYPEVINFTRYQCFMGQSIEYEGESYLCNNFGIADPSFFRMFSFPFIKGDPNNALSEKFSIVLTESMAKKFFGDEDPMGKTMFIQISRNPFTVTGVIKDVPETSHMYFECVMPFIVCKDWFHADPESWKLTMYYTYIQLRKGSRPEEVNSKISGIIKEHDETATAEIYLQSIKDVHLRSNFTGDLRNYKKGDIKYIYIYSITALSILLIACINFMNLSTARSTRRAKEVGLRKVIGAYKKNLLTQFLGESILQSVFALFLAVFLVIIILPTFNNLTNKDLVFNFSIDPLLIAGCFAITIFTGIISGIYPAFFLSGLKPVNILRNFGFKGSRGGVFFRKLIVVFQFVLSVILISGTLIVFEQLDYIKNRSLGYDSSNIVNVSGYLFWRSPEVVTNELLSNPNIISISHGIAPGYPLRGYSSIEWEGKSLDQDITYYPAYVDYSYLETFDMRMSMGRFFSREFAADENNLVINETAARVMGLENPIGTKIKYEIQDMGTGRFDETEKIVIGVIKDFHQSSLHNSIEPMIFVLNTQLPFVSIKIRPDNTSETLAFLEDTWNKYVDYPYTYSFLDEKIEKFYTNDQKTGSVFSYFSILTIFISCLGLFGLASYTAEQRKKEIGIRKVLGSSITGITLMLSKESVKSVTLSLIIAYPVTWFIMSKWLNGFAYRTNIGIMVFLISGFLAFAIALLAVSFQVIKAASVNPVETIKNE